MTPDKRYVLRKAVRARFGDCSTMTIWRWEHDEDLGFPQPIMINGRAYYDLDEIEAFERRQIAKSLEGRRSAASVEAA